MYCVSVPGYGLCGLFLLEREVSVCLPGRRIDFADHGSGLALTSPFTLEKNRSD